MRGSCSSSSWRRGARACSSSSSWVVAVVVLGPLLLVYFLVFGVDSGASWFSSSSSYSSTRNNGLLVGSIRGEEEHEKFHLDIMVEKGDEPLQAKLVPNTSTDHQEVISLVSQPPLASPSPAPEPVRPFQRNSQFLVSSLSKKHASSF